MKVYHNVQQTEEPMPTPVDPPPIRSEFRFYRKLGIYNICAVILGCAALLTAIAFITFLWIGADEAIHGRDPPQLWYTIINRGWATRMVTISSALIRIATAAQLGVFAAIIAALMLETMSTSATDFPLLSIIRCVNTGPQTLWRVLPTPLRTISQFTCSVAIITAIGSALALQFTSTILLTDFGSAHVILGWNTTNIKFGVQPLRYTETTAGMNFWKTTPSTYPRFAEYHEAPYVADGYVDTGKTYRALLPFDSPEKRGSLRNFTGVTTIVDARIMCVKPILESFSPKLYSSDLSVIGSLGWAHGFPALRQSDNFDGKFNCSVSLPDPIYDKMNWSINLCSLGLYIGNMTEGIKTDHDNVGATYTTAYLFLNLTGTTDAWMIGLEDLEINDEELVQTTSGPWLTLSHADLRLDTSLCFTNPNPSDYAMEMWSSSDHAEPTMGWDDITGTYLTDDIRRMLGATTEPLSTKDRGILELQPASNWSAREADIVYNTKTINFIWDVNYAFHDESSADMNVVAAFTPIIATSSKNTVHRSHGAILQHILDDTKNPALALQSLFTILMQMAYYDFLPQFDVRAPTRYASSSTVVVPVQWKGFGVIICLLLLHFVLILAAIVVFLARTELSLLGNAWQSVAQVASKDMADAIYHASAMTDYEVKKLIEMSGSANGRAILKRSVENGRSEAVLYEFVQSAEDSSRS